MVSNLFKGRIGRGTFFFSLLLVRTALQIIYLSFKDFRSGSKDSSYILISLLYILVLLIFLAFYLSVFTKRFHDLGKSGYWSMVAFIPYVQWVAYVMLIFKRGEDGANKYGDKPQRLVF
jgi:uncharacterized membrane protein YhaH (DUF805 family)